MKKTYLLATAALVAFGMTSCGGSTEEAAENTPVTYTLDASATTLEWKGDYADDSHSHNGTVEISEGTVVYTGDEFTSGTFTVDMATIKDKDLPSPDSDTLNSHLAGPYFFQTANYPATKVTIKEVSDKEVKAVINVMGKDIETSIPVKLKKTDKKVTAKGKFAIDFSALDMNGTKAMDPKFPTQYVKPVINFDLKLVMKAEEVPAK